MMFGASNEGIGTAMSGPPTCGVESVGAAGVAGDSGSGVVRTQAITATSASTGIARISGQPRDSRRDRTDTGRGPAAQPTCRNRAALTRGRTGRGGRTVRREATCYRRQLRIAPVRSA